MGYHFFSPQMIFLQMFSSKEQRLNISGSKTLNFTCKLKKKSKMFNIFLNIYFVEHEPDSTYRINLYNNFSSIFDHRVNSDIEMVFQSNFRSANSIIIYMTIQRHGPRYGHGISSTGLRHR